MSQRDKLLDLEKTEKYLFHGSGNSGIDIMDPRQAFNYVNGVQEKDGEPSVFASDKVDFAILMAMVNAYNCKNGFSSGAGTSKDENRNSKLTLKISKSTSDQLNENSVGYVYVFNKKDFTKRDPDGVEYICKTEVSPIEKIEVRKSDLSNYIEITMDKIIFLNPENASEEEVKSWKVREAARGVVVDEEGKVGVLHVSKNNYYKLAGGGIDEGEDKVEAFKRECLEELGSNVEVVGELGEVEEWRKIFLLKQISYCYIGKIIGEKGVPNFTESELENGFEIVWLEPKEALEKIQNAIPSNFEGAEYIKKRDVAIMEKFLKS